VQAARQQWWESQPMLDVTKLVFLDETGVTTNMTRTHGRFPKGARCVAAVPQGHWPSTTFITGLRVDALPPRWCWTVPWTARPSAAICARSCASRSNPVISSLPITCPVVKWQASGGLSKPPAPASAIYRHTPPDFKPIENLFAKLKALLKKAAHRSVAALCQEIRQPA
jgi:hypothetical protein